MTLMGRSLVVSAVLCSAAAPSVPANVDQNTLAAVFDAEGYTVRWMAGFKTTRTAVVDDNATREQAFVFDMTPCDAGKSCIKSLEFSDTWDALPTLTQAKVAEWRTGRPGYDVTLKENADLVLRYRVVFPAAGMTSKKFHDLLAVWKKMHSDFAVLEKPYDNP